MAGSMPTGTPSRRWLLHALLTVLTLGLWLGGLSTLRFWRQGKRRAATWAGSATALVAVVWAVALAGGEGSSRSSAGDDDAPAAATSAGGDVAPTTAAPAQTSAPATAETAEPPPAPALVGFGATREEWYARHEPAPDPQLAEGCCFGPLLSDGSPSIYAAFWSDDGRINGYSVRFDRPVPAADALRTVKAHAPPDARLLFDVEKDRCRMLQYRSAVLARELGSDGGMLVALYSNVVGEPYTGRVVNAIFTALLVGKNELSC
jgi:hypothetical protein